MINSQERDERRAFVHQRIIGGIGGFLTGGPTGAIGGFLSGGRRRPRTRTRPGILSGDFVERPPAIRIVSGKEERRSQGAMPVQGGCPSGSLQAIWPPGSQHAGRSGCVPSAIWHGARVGAAFAPNGVQTCLFPSRWDAISGSCKIFLGSQPGPDPIQHPIMVPGNGSAPGGPPVGTQPVMPGATSRTTLRCPRRYVLGIDDMCYFNLPRNSKWRKWRPGRKPLFTGGDLNAIKRAGALADDAEDIFRSTNPAKKAVARNYRANWRKPLKK